MPAALAHYRFGYDDIVSVPLVTLDVVSVLLVAGSLVCISVLCTF